MKITLFFLLLWLFGGNPADAQAFQKGPWQVACQWVREKNEDGWGWGSPDTTVLNRDTTTVRRCRKVLSKVAWDVSPDSIRLFLNCENPLLVPPRPRSGRRPLRFTVTGATLRIDEKQQLLWLFPSKSEVILTAYQGRRIVVKQVFQAVPPPLPDVKCFADNGIVRGNVSKPFYSINLRAIPTESFADFMPYDARYRVSQTRITVLKNGTTAAPSIIVRSSYDLAELKGGQAGDRILVEVLLIERRNFCGDVEKVSMKKQFLIPFPQE